MNKLDKLLYRLGFLMAMFVLFSVLYFVGLRLHILRIGYLEFIVTIYLLYAIYSVAKKAVPKRYKMPNMRMD